MERLVSATFKEPTNAAALDDESLVIHQRTKDSQSEAIIIFVHGLGGRRYGPKSTWGKFPAYIDEDFEQADVGLYEYQTLFRRLKFWRSRPLEAEANVFADIIRDVPRYRSIILAGHSMGGLLCMAAIAYLVNTGQIDALSRIRGLILMATPQTGSQRVPRVLTWISKDFYALKPHGGFVYWIHRTFRDRIILDDSESKRRKYAIPTWAVLGASDFWVDKLSSRIGLSSDRTKTVSGTHKSIVKPKTKTTEAYQYVHGCINECLQRPQRVASGSEKTIHYLDPAQSFNTHYARFEAFLRRAADSSRIRLDHHIPSGGDPKHILEMLGRVLPKAQQDDVLVVISRGFESVESEVQELIKKWGSLDLVFADQEPPPELLKLHNTSYIGPDNWLVGSLAALGLMAHLKKKRLELDLLTVEGPGGPRRSQGFLDTVTEVYGSSRESVAIMDADRFDTIDAVRGIVTEYTSVTGFFSGNDETAAAFNRALDEEEHPAIVIGCDGTREMRAQVEQEGPPLINTILTYPDRQADRIVEICMEGRKGVQEYKRPTLYRCDYKARQLIKGHANLERYWSSPGFYDWSDHLSGPPLGK